MWNILIDICAFTSTGVAIFLIFLQSARHQKRLLYIYIFWIFSIRQGAYKLSGSDPKLFLDFRNVQKAHISSFSRHWQRVSCFDCPSSLPDLSGFIKEEDSITSAVLSLTVLESCLLYSTHSVWDCMVLMLKLSSCEIYIIWDLLMNAKGQMWAFSSIHARSSRLALSSFNDLISAVQSWMNSIPNVDFLASAITKRLNCFLYQKSWMAPKIQWHPQSDFGQMVCLHFHHLH